ncbi:MAG: nucleotide sugar dehydrogenase, partial [Betaproteobacteria bacterium]
MSHQGLLERIAGRKARIGVIGLGYVGLPLACEFARQGFDVTGFDVDESKVRQINGGRSYIPDVPGSELGEVVRGGRLRATTDMRQLGDMDVIDIAVPTPLRKTRDPDLSYVVKAVEAVAATLKPGQLIVLESTTYPGTTDEVVQPMLEAGGLKADVDFFLAFSPERVDPGNQQFTTRTIPKVVGGIGPASTEVAAALYRAAVTTVVPVSSTRVAEMVKLLENTFRAVNIGLVNEIALMCHKMDIDVWEVIDAAKTKPFGFMPFYPGPGLGGHCIPIDPFYLSWKARQTGFECRFIELAGHVNSSMPDYVVSLVADALNSVKKSINGSRVHLFGVAYKRDVNDLRESPALDVLELLARRGARVTYTDPWVAELRHAGQALESVPFDAAISTAQIDCAVITTDHTAFDYAR